MGLMAGQQIIFKVCCPICGVPQQQSAIVSDFFLLCCKNKEWDSYMAEFLVERRTGQVLVSNYREHKDFEGNIWRPVYEKVKREEE